MKVSVFVFHFHLFSLFSSSVFSEFYLSLFVGLSLTNLIFSVSLLYHSHSSFAKKKRGSIEKVFNSFRSTEIS